MDLLDKIAATEFLGSELLLFLWFASEVCESELPVGRDVVIGLWLDDQLQMAHPAVPSEKAALKGVAPSGTPEAKEALRQGKLPQRAHLGLRIEERQFAFTLDALSLAPGGIKLPEVLTGGGDDEEPFYERMMLLDQLDEVLGALTERFIRLRLSRSWAQSILPLMVAWVQERDDFDPDAAKRAVVRVLKKD